MFDRNSTNLDRTFLAVFWQNHIFDRTFRKIWVWQNSKSENVLSKRRPFRRFLSYVDISCWHSVCIYGSKSAGREKSALSVTNEASLGESPFPNHPSYRLGSFAQLEFYCWGTRTRIFTFLDCQETYAGKGWNFLKIQEIYIFKKRPKTGLKAGNWKK